MSNLLKKIDNDNKIKLFLVITGTHHQKKFGNSFFPLRLCVHCAQSSPITPHTIVKPFFQRKKIRLSKYTLHVWVHEFQGKSLSYKKRDSCTGVQLECTQMYTGIFFVSKR